MEGIKRGACGSTELIFRHPRPVEIWELLNFKAIAMIPWDWEITTFVELYRLGIPLFVPQSQFMQAMIWHCMRKAELRIQQRFIRFRHQWWQGANCHLQPTDSLCRQEAIPGNATLVDGELPPWL